jgi:2'-5' RNA ligase
MFRCKDLYLSFPHLSTVRLFIAIEIPEQVKDYVIGVEEQLKNKDDNITWVKPENMHLTLKFLGEVDDGKANSIIEALKQVKFEPFEAALSDIGAFPGFNYMRVLWVGLEPHDKINALQQQVDEKMKAAGFPRDDRFHPHLTIARVKFIKHKAELTDKLKKIQIEKLSFNVSKIKLIKSTLTPKGPVYEVLSEFLPQSL